MAQFRWNLNKDTKLFFGVGPYVAFCLKNKFDSNPYYLKGSAPGIHEQYYDSFVYGKDAWENDNLYLYDEARRFDWGVSSNIGIETHTGMPSCNMTSLWAKKARTRDWSQLSHADAFHRI